VVGEFPPWIQHALHIIGFKGSFGVVLILVALFNRSTGTLEHPPVRRLSKADALDFSPNRFPTWRTVAGLDALPIAFPHLPHDDQERRPRFVGLRARKATSLARHKITVTPQRGETDLFGNRREAGGRCAVRSDPHKRRLDELDGMGLRRTCLGPPLRLLDRGWAHFVIRHGGKTNLG
jgi:hypothetical protein